MFLWPGPSSNLFLRIQRKKEPNTLHDTAVCVLETKDTLNEPMLLRPPQWGGALVESQSQPGWGQDAPRTLAERECSDLPNNEDRRDQEESATTA